jgi:hypothetical protein
MKSDFELVFVHLGKAKASHLWANIKGIQNTLPDIAITLVSDQDENLKRAQKMGIGAFVFIPDSKLESAMATSEHNIARSFQDFLLPKV